MGKQSSGWLRPTGDNDCKHTLAKFKKHSHGIYQESNSKMEKDTAAGGAGAASASAHSNFQAFRFLWSSTSQILSVHFIQLNPYMLQTQSTNNRHFKRIMQENYELLLETTVQPTPPVPGCKANEGD